jgi:hypothetical protein
MRAISSREGDSCCDCALAGAVIPNPKAATPTDPINVCRNVMTCSFSKPWTDAPLATR